MVMNDILKNDFSSSSDWSVAIHYRLKVKKNNICFVDNFGHFLIHLPN